MTMLLPLAAALCGTATVGLALYLAYAAARGGAASLLMMAPIALLGLIAQVAAIVGLMRRQRSGAMLQILLAFGAAAFVLHWYLLVSFSDDVARTIARAPTLVWAGPMLATAAIIFAWRKLR